MKPTIFRRSFGLFLVTICFATPMSCAVAPTTVPTSSEVPTMNTFVMPAVPPLSVPFDIAWRFSVDKEQVGEQQGWMDRGFDDSSWITVNVPHTWNVMPEYSEYEGLGWYRRTFTIPEEARNGHLRLKFEAVFYLARVWLNGPYLGQPEGGYSP